MSLNELIAVARGDRPADLLLKNGRIINVFSGNIVPGDIAIADGFIAGIGPYAAERTIDLKGRYVAPGLIDAHLHIESSMTSVSAFARAVAPTGTTTVVADPHEIANVMGAAGIRYMLERSGNQPVNVYYTLPSCVPATDMETSGARLAAEDLAEFMGHPRILGLAEMMNFPGVIGGDPDVLAKLRMARKSGKPLDGHAPGLGGQALNAYLAAGMASDHECTTADEALEKLSAGMWIMVREGTGARNLESLLPVVTEKTCHRMMWCTDDRHPHDILTDGHLDHVIRKAVGLGLDPVMAIRMGTLNPALYFGIRDSGAIAPGRRADLWVFSDLASPRAEIVFSGGRLIAENGQMVDAGGHSEEIPPAAVMHIDPATVGFDVAASDGRLRVIRAIPDQVVTEETIMTAVVENGLAKADPSRDLLKMAVVERYTGKAGTGIGFVTGIGLHNGALASSVAHDSHNVIVVGADDGDMRCALAEVVRNGGGLAVVSDGEVRASLPLPIAGLMSPESMKRVRVRLDVLMAATRALGSPLHDPFMTLSFLALPVIPALKLTDKGLVDVRAFRQVPLFLD